MTRLVTLELVQARIRAYLAKHVQAEGRELCLELGLKRADLDFALRGMVAHQELVTARVIREGKDSDFCYRLSGRFPKPKAGRRAAATTTTERSMPA